MQYIPAASQTMEPASHEDPCDPGVWKRVIATKQSLIRGQIQMVNWARLPVGRSFARHYHEDMEEVFILVSGQARMTVGDHTVDMIRGDTVVVAPREIHAMENAGETDVEYVVFGVSTEQDGKTIVVE